MAWVKSPTSVLRDIGISQPHEIDLDFIAYTLNAEVIYEPLQGYEANIFGSKDKAVITVNSGTQVSRQRFSLAHEIGHWTNDRGKNLSIECSTGDINQKQNGKGLTAHQAREARANVFASHLMMPEFMMVDIANMPVNMDTVRFIASTYNTSLVSSAGRLIELTKKPALVALWSHNGTRRWFDRSASLSDSIWPLQSIPHPPQAFIESNNTIVSDSKWIDPRSAKGEPLTESVFDNGFDIISLLSWT